MRTSQDELLVIVSVVPLNQMVQASGPTSQRNLCAPEMVVLMNPLKRSAKSVSVGSSPDGSKGIAVCVVVTSPANARMRWFSAWLPLFQ